MTTAVERLHNWRAKRAGGRITIYAKDDAGNDRRVPNVDTIESDRDYPTATDKDGRQYALLNDKN